MIHNHFGVNTKMTDLNTELDISANQTEAAGIEFISMHTTIGSMMRLEGAIIVALNITVVLTLSIKKDKFPSVYWLQLLCLASNDTLAGLANFFISFIDVPFIGDSLVNCASVIAFMLITQSASLFNIFGISVHRFLILKGYNRSGFIWRPYYTIICTVTAWTLSTLLCMTPILLYHKPASYANIKYCAMEHIFGADKRKGMLSMVVGPFMIPLVFINIIYVVLVCKFRTSANRIRPRVATMNTSSVPTIKMNLSEESTSASPGNHKPNGPELYDNSTPSGHKKPKPIINNYLQVPNIRIPSAKKSVTKTQHSMKRKMQASTSRCPEQQSSWTQSAATKRQRRAFTLLGIILLFLNIFSWPLVVSLILKYTVTTFVFNRNVVLMLFGALCLNSAVNPLLYTARIPEFRTSLLEIILSIRYRITCNTRRQ